jgi:hypothetical protein
MMSKTETMLYEVTCKLRVRAAVDSKRDAAAKVRMLLATSASPIRDIDIVDIATVDEE